MGHLLNMGIKMQKAPAATTTTTTTLLYKIEFISITITFSTLIDCGGGLFGFYNEGYYTYAIRTACGGSNTSSHPNVSFNLNRFCNSTDFGFFQTITINNGTATANTDVFTFDDGCGTNCDLQFSGTPSPSNFSFC